MFLLINKVPQCFFSTRSRSAFLALSEVAVSPVLLSNNNW